MTVNAIQSNEQRRTILVPMTKGAAIGAVSGLALKYAYPVTADEKNTDEYIKISKKINNQKTEYNTRTQNFINSIKAQEKNSLAQDEFVKLFDGLKEGDHVKRSNLRETLKKLADKPSEMFEFKKLCKTSSAIAEESTKQCMSAYNLITKHIRPTGFFLATGAIVGAIIGLVNDIIKVETGK